LTVPLYLKVSPQNPITTEPYIKSTNSLTNKWSEALSANTKPVIGLNWRGNRADTLKQNRNIPAEYFETITRTCDANFLSLQKDSRHSESETIFGVEKTSKLQPEINAIANSDASEDFLEYVAIIENCDLVITTATTVAHIAGGMGKPTWILLERIPDWRWGLEGNSCFWYPSARLFRQKDHGDWKELIQVVARELKKYLKEIQ
jgi:ADP-heptose:LPS heptosyltransferase